MKYKITIDDGLSNDYWYGKMPDTHFIVDDKIDDESIVFFGLTDTSQYYIVTEGKYDGCLILKKHCTLLYEAPYYERDGLNRDRFGNIIDIPQMKKEFDDILKNMKVEEIDEWIKKDNATYKR